MNWLVYNMIYQTVWCWWWQQKNSDTVMNLFGCLIIPFSFFEVRVFFPGKIRCFFRCWSIQPRYFWWNYFLNKFNLFDRLLGYLLHHLSKCTFSDETFSSVTALILLSHGAWINFFIWMACFLFPHIFLFINSIFLSFQPLIFCHLPSCCQVYRFLFFFGCGDCWLQWIS